MVALLANVLQLRISDCPRCFDRLDFATALNGTVVGTRGCDLELANTVDVCFSGDVTRTLFLSNKRAAMLESNKRMNTCMLHRHCMHMGRGCGLLG